MWSLWFKLHSFLKGFPTASSHFFTDALLDCGRAKVIPIYSKIQPPVPESPASHGTESETVVRYLHLSEIPGKYSVGIFVFPPFGKMPLHDHPGMCVLSRVLYGSLERTSLDLSLALDNDRDTTSDGGAAYFANEVTKRRKADHGYCRKGGLLDSFWQRMSWRHAATTTTTIDGGVGKAPPAPTRVSSRAYRKRVDHLEAPQCTALYPKEGNLHQFMAGPNGAAILDVLIPPYDLHHRDCNYYEIVMDPFTGAPSTSAGSEQQQPTNTTVAAAGSKSMLYHPTTTTTTSSLSFCWIMPIDKPENFHCMAGQYRNIGSAD